MLRARHEAALQVARNRGAEPRAAESERARPGVAGKTPQLICGIKPCFPHRFPRHSGSVYRHSSSVMVARPFAPTRSR